VLKLNDLLVWLMVRMFHTIVVFTVVSEHSHIVLSELQLTIASPSVNKKSRNLW